MRTEGWLVSYGLLGLTQNGLVPVLMPLLAADGGGAGLTYAAFSLLGLFAPVLGSWADRFGRHRELRLARFREPCETVPHHDHRPEQRRSEDEGYPSKHRNL